MKAYCKNCTSLQPSRFRPGKDAVTGEPYKDLCCDTCHFIVATVQEREDLAQPAQEPVAWAVQGCSKMWREEFAEIDAKAEAKRIGGTCVAYALYISPPQRPWVGLTPEDILVLFDEHNLYGSKLVEFTRAVETKIKEKNNG
jgi:hypothetical protein